MEVLEKNEFRHVLSLVKNCTAKAAPTILDLLIALVKTEVKSHKVITKQGEWVAIGLISMYTAILLVSGTLKKTVGNKEEFFSIIKANLDLTLGCYGDELYNHFVEFHKNVKK